MNDQDFLLLVKKKGVYTSRVEASRAVNAVFSTVKSWISPEASRQIRKMLPRDAAQLWQYSSVCSWSKHKPLWKETEFAHLILRVQQSGKYNSSADAQRAYGSVLAALNNLFPLGAGMIFGKPIPTAGRLSVSRLQKDPVMI